jgi:hypothetical protein
MFGGSARNGWEEDEKSTNMLLGMGDKRYIVHTCGDGYPVGDQMCLEHDQSFRPIGGIWTVLAVQPHTKAGLAELAKVAGKRPLVMATFK